MLYKGLIGVNRIYIHMINMRLINDHMFIVHKFEVINLHYDCGGSYVKIRHPLGSIVQINQQSIAINPY